MIIGYLDPWGAYMYIYIYTHSIHTPTHKMIRRFGSVPSHVRGWDEGFWWVSRTLGECDIARGMYPKATSLSHEP